MDENRKMQLLGEARLLRAYYYYNLVRIFGEVPLITEPVGLTSPELYPSEASQEDIYSLIVEDLVSAESSGLPFNDNTGRISLGAVKSLMSSVYLTMAGYPLQKGPEFYQKAADKAEEVILADQYSLFASYNDLHNEATENLGENILMVQFEAFIMPSNWQTSIIPYNKGISEYSDETEATYANTDFVESYEPGDLRTKEKKFYYTEYTLTHIAGESPKSKRF